VIDLKLDNVPLPPFARIYYWFELFKKDGTSFKTPSYWFDYLDNRFTWQASDTDLFHISWVEGDAAFGQKLQEIARNGLKKATTLLPVTPALPIRIFVYPNVDAMQQDLTLTGQTWTAGHASPDIGVVLVSNDTPSTESIEMERQIPHELMHILEYQVTGTQYSSIPVWLSEGLATSVELYPNPDLQRALNDAQASGTLLPFESLCAGFSPDANTAQLDYAQSFSFVNYLNGRFGSDVFLKLLANASSGLTCENSVSTTLQVSLPQLQQDWTTATFNGGHSIQSLEVYLPYVILAVLLLVMAILFFVRKRHTKEDQ
jgi:hypothetical protein